MKDKNKVVYQITIEDVQEVALQELDRELTEEEVKKLIDPIAERISWYDAIADAINEHFGYLEDNKDE
jgi:hypothetical protein